MSTLYTLFLIALRRCVHHSCAETKQYQNMRTLGARSGKRGATWAGIAAALFVCTTARLCAAAAPEPLPAPVWTVSCELRAGGLAWEVAQIIREKMCYICIWPIILVHSYTSNVLVLVLVMKCLWSFPCLPLCFMLPLCFACLPLCLCCLYVLPLHPPGWWKSLGLALLSSSPCSTVWVRDFARQMHPCFKTDSFTWICK